MKIAIHVRIIPRSGLLDPQGQAIAHALSALGFSGVGDVRVGKAIELEVEAPSTDAAEASVRAMCERLLANPVTEDFAIEVGGR
jgi:phosphoribosylformylglycinamidine synthase